MRKVSITWLGIIGFFSVSWAPIFKAAAAVVPMGRTAKATDSLVDFNSRAVFSRKPASGSSAQSTMMTSKFLVVTFSTASKDSEQWSTWNSSSSRTWRSTRAVFSSDENSSSRKAIRLRLAGWNSGNKLRRACRRH